jgi:hypothetical protein
MSMHIPTAVTPHEHSFWLFGGWVKLRGWLSHHHHVFHIASLIVLTGMLIAVVGQFLYPTDHVLPGLRLGGIAIGGKDRQTLMRRLADYAQLGKVTLKTPSRTVEANWQTIGLSVDETASAEVALSYEWWERLIPFSSVVRVVQSMNAPLIGIVDDDRLQAFAEKVVAEDTQAAHDATINVKDGQLSIDEAKSGYHYTVAEVERQVKALAMNDGQTVELVPQLITPSRSKEELQTSAHAYCWQPDVPARPSHNWSVVGF